MNEVHTIQSEALEVRVKELGAELASIRSKDTGIEYLWQGDPAWWPKQSPLLFPVIARLRNQRYSVDGQEYELGIHGFAASRTFTLAEQHSQELRLVLASDAETRAVYPFDFRLAVTYRVAGTSLEVRFEVANTGEHEMLFSIGGHPGFNCPLEEELSFDDYYLEFEQPEAAESRLVTPGEKLLSGERRQVLDNQQRLPLKHELFEDDALIFDSLESRSVTLRSDQGRHGIEMDFAEFPVLGIWTKAEGAPFLCLEPWNGLPDHADASGRLEDKEGIRRLAPGASFTCRYGLTCF